jgi:hypothetical protein
MAVGVLRHGALLAGRSDRRAARCVVEKTADSVKTVVGRPPHRGLAVGLEQRVQIFLKSVSRNAPTPVASNRRMLPASRPAMSIWELSVIFERRSVWYISPPHTSP